MYQVDNAVIMAAGTASRFAPLSYEMPKALITVKGEVLIERQIRQLQEAGIRDIIVVVGYMKEKFEYLKDKFQVKIVENKEYLTRNNNASIYAVKKYLRNTYLCSSDNYFTENPFIREVSDSYYAGVYADGKTEEWCMYEDEEGFINRVTIGGSQAWFMLGHTFWNEEFSRRFIEILDDVYEKPETSDLLWESIYVQHLDELKMRIRKYEDNVIFEFDTLDELRGFDSSYIDDTRSEILKKIAEELNCRERDIINIHSCMDVANAPIGFTFDAAGKRWEYSYKNKEVREIKDKRN